MNFKIGDKVSRISHNHDIVFIIENINGNIAYLKGEDIRLYADSTIEDLVISSKSDSFIPEECETLDNRDEFFYLPGKILHIDGDKDYLEKSLKYYSKCGLFAIGKCISETNIKNNIFNLLNTIKPDILVITGHDAYYKNNSSYKNSKFFIDSVIEARKYEKSHEKLVIIAGACQSDYESIIKSGANFASSPKRINIHALDPAIIASNIALSDRNSKIDIKKLLSKTKYGKDGIGGILGNGMMYVGYPR